MICDFNLKNSKLIVYIYIQLKRLIRKSAGFTSANEQEQTRTTKSMYKKVWDDKEKAGKISRECSLRKRSLVWNPNCRCFLIQKNTNAEHLFVCVVEQSVAKAIMTVIREMKLAMQTKVKAWHNQIS